MLETFLWIQNIVWDNKKKMKRETHGQLTILEFDAGEHGKNYWINNLTIWISMKTVTGHLIALHDSRRKKLQHIFCLVKPKRFKRWIPQYLITTEILKKFSSNINFSKSLLVALWRHPLYQPTEEIWNLKCTQKG